MLIRGGTIFDGDGGPGVAADVLVRDDRVIAMGIDLEAPPGAQVVDATGCWVTPGFVDMHTHYDAEIEVDPGLPESVRHGVTTVVMGSCGLGMSVGEPEDLADMFCRVEGIPRRHVLPLIERVKDWNSVGGYLGHLDALPLGPNVAVLLGHSTLRAHVMGLGRSTDSTVRVAPEEVQQMRQLLREGLDAGYLGLSINALPLDKMGGDRFLGRSTPSVFASLSEYRALNDELRARGALLQALPDVTRPQLMLAMMAMSTGWRRRSLRLSLLTLIDPGVAPGLHRPLGALASIANRLGRGEIRMQALPCPFDVFVDGIDAPVFEELGAGNEALSIEDLPERAKLLSDAGYRQRFRQDWKRRLGRAYHRNLDEARIIGCPDPTVVGKTFGEIARERGLEPVDTLLDLAAEHGASLRWRTCGANGRPKEVERIVHHPVAMIGFSDAGAHLRNMAFYNLALMLLRKVRLAEAEGRSFMTVGQAVQRCTSDIADFLQLDAGRIGLGRRADLVVIDPAELTEQVDRYEEAPMGPFPDIERVVKRNDSAVRLVVVAGKTAWTSNGAGAGLGAEGGFGRLLRRSGG
jgi:N-acyl-D-aspartate/D-glutamate deacylase